MTQSKFEKKEAAAGRKKLWIRLTHICNNDCVFCLDQKNQNGKVIEYAVILEQLRKGRKEKYERVVLSGGEPTLHPKLKEVIRAAKGMGYAHVQIITNGRMLAYPKFAKELKDAGLDEITFSMHAHTKELLEKITRIKGSHIQAMSGLKNALENKFIVSVDIVINRTNYKYLREIMEFFIRFGITEFDLLYLIPFGSAWENWKEVIYSQKSGAKYLEKALELDKDPNVFIWTNRLPARLLEGHEDLIQTPVKLKDDLAGMQEMFERYVKEDEMMSCRGKRCRSCVMHDFCDDLVSLKNEGEIKSCPNPKCIREKRKEKKYIYRGKNFDLFAFADFFIQERYFVKSLRCATCVHDKNCSGVWIEDVRQKGFNILKPKN